MSVKKKLKQSKEVWYCVAVSAWGVGIVRIKNPDRAVFKIKNEKMLHDCFYTNDRERAMLFRKGALALQNKIVSCWGKRK